MSGTGEFLSPSIPGGGKRSAGEQAEDSNTKITAKIRRTEWNILNKTSKSKTDVSDADVDMDDDISSVDSNNVYNTLPRNSAGNENFKSRRDNNKNVKAKQVPPPITVFGLKYSEIIDLVKTIVSDDDFGIKLTKNGTKIFVHTIEQHRLLKETFKKKQKSIFHTEN